MNIMDSLGYVQYQYVLLLVPLPIDIININIVDIEWQNSFEIVLDGADNDIDNRRIGFNNIHFIIVVVSVWFINLDLELVLGF